MTLLTTSSLFGNENLWAQSVMTGALALLIFAGLLIIVAVDHPFSGTLHVPPEAARSDFVGQG
ncbi:MAG: hypothetical protein U1E40_00350 [Amaricoccus sp.]